MGITGLWKIVEPTGTEIPLECLEGKKLAVDISIWIYQAQLAYPSEQLNPHIRLLINRLCKLLFYRIRPVFVFDGPNVPALKRNVLEARRLKKFNDDDIIKNPNKMHHLKQIAKGELTESELAKSVQVVISPSKKVILNDVYRDMPNKSTIDLTKSDELKNDQIYISNSSEDDEIEILDESGPSTSELKPTTTRRETLEKLVEMRETIRNSRLHPSMIPADSLDFSKFQMNRLLRRGKLNNRIQEIAKGPGIPIDKVNVVGPDGTQHILRYLDKNDTTSTPIQETRGGIELSLEHFTLPEVTKSEKIGGEIVKEEEYLPREKRMKEDIFYSKSGMLEVIARKRMKKHFTESENTDRSESSDEDDFIDVDDNIMESRKEEQVEWDPQKYDHSSTEEFGEDWVRLNYEENDKTPELYRDLQEVLTNCGIPWLEAPGEAEAQCVELERLGLVDGIISDDSDVWAFGAHRVYRNMFAKNKRVQRYGERSVRNAMFCLEREDYIVIAVLAGGDYCSGLNKIGAVGALELIAGCMEKRVVKIEDFNEIEQRIMGILGRIRDLFDSQSPNVNKNLEIIKRRVREANEQSRIEKVCTNRDAVRAYLYPTVDSSTEKFRWRPLSSEIIRKVMRQKLHTDSSLRESNEERNSLAALERWNEFLATNGSSQMRLNRFFAHPYNTELVGKWSKKVCEALNEISKRANHDKLQEEVETRATTEKSNIKKRGEKKVQVRRRGKPRGKAEKKELLLSEDSSNDSF